MTKSPIKCFHLISFTWKEVKPELKMSRYLAPKAHGGFLAHGCQIVFQTACRNFYYPHDTNSEGLQILVQTCQKMLKSDHV